MVMNSKGGSSSEIVRISYEQCPLGMRQQTELDQQTKRNNEGYQCGMECVRDTHSFLNLSISMRCIIPFISQFNVKRERIRSQ